MRLAAIALVAQGAMNSLNPVLRVREQIVDGFSDHGDTDVLAARLRPGLPNCSIGRTASRGGRQVSARAERRYEAARVHRHRHQPAPQGDHRRRADERAGRRGAAASDGDAAAGPGRAGAAIILVGHDMGLMAQFVDRVGVMYAGHLVEVSPVARSFEPLHPYSAAAHREPAVVRAKGRFQGIPGLAAFAARPASRVLVPRRAARTRWSAAPSRSRACARCGPSAVWPATSMTASADADERARVR